MGFADGRASAFRIADAGGTMRDLSGSVTEVSGLPGARALNDATALGADGASYAPGADSAMFTLRGLFDGAAAGGADATLSGLRRHGEPTAFEYAPGGVAPGGARYAGLCWVKSYELTSRAGAFVEWRAALLVEGSARREIVPQPLDDSGGEGE